MNSVSGEGISDLIPDIEIAYKELRPQMLDALAKLARRGFVVSPWDGLDLIHDFFVEAWDGIKSRYNPAKGSVNTYTYWAFVHFARPRIIKLQRLQRSLIEPEQLDLLSSEADEDEEAYVPPEDSKQVVREALSHLPLREREILSRYLYSKPHAERILAKKFSLSRYRLRQILVGALGQVMVRLDKPTRMLERDWKVAVALWRDKRSLDETSAYLGLTIHQVREANSRNVHLLAEALKYYHPRRSGQLRRNTMKSQQNSNSPHDLLEEALKSPGNTDLLEQVRDRADEVLVALENSESFGLSEDEMRAVDPLWVAEVYQAMSTAVGQSDEESEASKALFHAHQEEEASVGVAFKETLMAGLPERLQNIGRWFYLVPQVDVEERRELIEEPSVQAGMPYSEQLIPYGVTPLTVFYATEAVSSLLDRLMRYEMLDINASVVLGVNKVEVEGHDNALLSIDLLVDEIEKVSECSERAAHALYAWSVGAAQYKPFLFSGFKASPREEGVSLARTCNVYDDLFQRWGLQYDFASATST
jgi:RNA polymerase sigma factor (sigma-70 family)